MNWKCIIGATILTPVAFMLIVGLAIGIAYLFKLFPLAHLIVACIGMVIFLGIIWLCLYAHCEERKE